MVVSIFVPSAAAHPFDGTEDSPELTDPEGDIAYGSLYTGGRDHDYIDLTASWFSYDAASDTVHFTMKLLDTSGLDPLPTDWSVTCTLYSDLYAGDEARGRLFQRWTVRIDPGAAPTLYSEVLHVQHPEGASETPRPIPHDFEMIYDEPGYAIFSYSRSGLLQLADGAEGFEDGCGEQFRPGGLPTSVVNSDGASSDGAYSWLDLRRLKTPEGEPDPFASLTTEAAASMSPDDQADTPSMSLAWGVIGVLAAVYLAVRRQRTR